MKIASIVAIVSLLLLAAPARAVAQTPPTQPAAAQAQPAQKPAPAQARAGQKPAAPAKPFPAGARFAVINVQQVAAESAEGKAANSKVLALNQKKVAELNEKNKVLQATQQKLAGVSLLSEDERAKIQKDVDRLNLEIQRFTQDAQSEVEELQEKLQVDFQRKLMPIIELVAVDKGIQIVFAHDSGVAFVDEGLDLTAEVIRRFDAAMGASSPKLPESEPFPADRRLSR